MRVLAALLVLILLPASVLAGAWPRERGTWFVSSSVQLGWPQKIDQWISPAPTSHYYTGYAEYGLPHDLTLGLDLGRADTGAGKTVVFLRMPLPEVLNGTKLAAELGLGAIDGRPVLRPGLSLGRGADVFGLQGWLSADALAEIAPGHRRYDLKLDLTTGLTLNSGAKVILQLQTGMPTGRDAFARLAPSVVLPFGRNRLAEVGLIYGLRGDETMGMKLGLWQTF